ncbi:hypothetical protein [Fodinicola feengrottensis]|nr:hypothetical protein [Fodinicola feengrottensis]
MLDVGQSRSGPGRATLASALRAEADSEPKPAIALTSPLAST